MKPTLLSDVDGVVADLMRGFAIWLDEDYNVQIDPADITKSHVAECELLCEQNEQLLRIFPETCEGGDGGIQGALSHFLETDDVYRRYVGLVPEAKEALAVLQGYVDIIFVTANMTRVPKSYVSKYWWLKKHFPNIPIITSPSGLKHMVRGEFAVDDRYDICQRWQTAGVRSFLFSQPWSEAPDGSMKYDWSRIVADVILSLELMDLREKGSFNGEF